MVYRYRDLHPNELLLLWLARPNLILSHVLNVLGWNNLMNIVLLDYLRWVSLRPLIHNYWYNTDLAVWIHVVAVLLNFILPIDLWLLKLDIIFQQVYCFYFKIIFLL